MVRLEFQGQTVELLSPTVEEAYSLPKIIKRTMSDKPIAYRTGQSYKTLRLNFGFLNRNKILEVLRLLRNAGDSEIMFIDKEKVTYGRVLTEVQDFTHVGRANSTFTLDFQCRN